MSDNEIALALEERKIEGKKVKHLRNDGILPAVIHDHGKASKSVMGSYQTIAKAYQDAGKHHPINLQVGSDKYLVLIKDVTIDPRKNSLMHVVFNAIKQDEKVKAEIPVRIDGDIPAVKAGLMVINYIDHVEIEALPKDLIDELIVSAEGLVEIGDRIHVSDITIPSGVELLTEPEQAIAGVEETKAQIAEEDSEETEEAGEEPGADAGSDKESTET